MLQATASSQARAPYHLMRHNPRAARIHMLTEYSQTMDSQFSPTGLSVLPDALKTEACRPRSHTPAPTPRASPDFPRMHLTLICCTATTPGCTKPAFPCLRLRSLSKGVPTFWAGWLALKLLLAAGEAKVLGVKNLPARVGAVLRAACTVSGREV